mgnify:CR=1 FL=1|tara:strand:- start:1761 stop:2309 length:549 start_codon:yes stop_codon:yes gene_type:complete
MWPEYKVIKNFLTEEHFKYVCSLHPELETENFNVLKCRVYLKDSKVEIVKGDYSGDLDMLKNMVLDIHNTYHDQCMKMLQELAPEKVDSVIFSELNFVCIPKESVYKIHNDTPNKLLSGVIYISPEENEGTWLYDTEDGDNPRQIQWEQNIAFFFSRNEEAWHSYKADGKNSRCALVYNLRS